MRPGSSSVTEQLGLQVLLLDAAALQKASDWPSFVWPATDAERLLLIINRADEDKIKVARGLLPAVVHGLQLLSEQPQLLSSVHQHPRQTATLYEVCLCLHMCLPRSSMPRPERVEASVLAKRTGLVLQLERLSNALACCINHATDAAETALLQASVIAPLAATLVWLFMDLAGLWPSDHAVFNDVFFPAVPTVAALSVATLRNKAACFFGDGNRAIQKRDCGFMQHTAFTYHLDSAIAAGYLAQLLCQCSYHYLACSSSSSKLLFWQMTSNKSVKELLLMVLGLAVQAAHQEQQGRPSVGGIASAPDTQRQQQQQQLALVSVPAYHEQLLRDLRVAEGLEFDVKMFIKCFVDQGFSGMKPFVIVADQCGLHTTDRRHSSKNSSSSSRPPPDSTAAAPAASHLLLVLLEFVALQPGNSYVVDCALQALGNQMQELQLLLLDSQEVAEACYELLPALLQVLLPAVQHGQRAASVREVPASMSATPPAAAAVATREEAQLVWPARVGALVAQATCNLVSCCDYDSSSSKAAQVFAAAVSQHEQHFCWLLEAHLRCGVREAESEGYYFINAWDTAWLGYLGLLERREHEQLSSLLISHLKAVAAEVYSGCGHPVAEADDVKGASSAMSSALEALNCAVAVKMCSDSSNSSSSSRSGSNETIRGAAAGAGAGAAGWGLWVHIVARSLVAVGKMFQLQEVVTEEEQQAGEAGIDDSDDGSSVEILQEMLDECITATAWLSAQGPDLVAGPAAAAVAGPALQQLLEVQVPLLVKQLKQLSSKVATTHSNGGDLCSCLQTQAVVDIGQQLEVIGAAVTAQLPVEHCCNYHGCRNFAKDSELELVSGKSCICGGCKVARYCSRACQAAHYKKWHKVVCRHIAARQQQQQHCQEQQQQKCGSSSSNLESGA